MSTPPLTIWLVTDGKPGHANQLRGLAERLASRTPARVIDIAVRPGRLHRWLSATPLPAGEPDLILCAGRATHRRALSARRARGGVLVVCMMPPGSLARFDLCLIPEHDEPPAVPNVVRTRGAIVRVRPSTAHELRRGLILVGGPSSAAGFSAADTAQRIGVIVSRDPDTAWDLTTSRRTPPGFLDALGPRENLRVTPAGDTPPEWVGDTLGRAGSAWITADSASMIAEALTSGAAVGVLPAPPRGRTPGRVARGVERFVAAGLATAYDDWLAGAPLTPPAEPLDEADRAAGIILERFFPGLGAPA